MILSAALHAFEESFLPASLAVVFERRAAAGPVLSWRNNQVAVGLLVSGATVGAAAVALRTRGAVEASSVGLIRVAALVSQLWYAQLLLAEEFELVARAAGSVQRVCVNAGAHGALGDVRRIAQLHCLECATLLLGTRCIAKFALNHRLVVARPHVTGALCAAAAARGRPASVCEFRGACQVAAELRNVGLAAALLLDISLVDACHAPHKTPLRNTADGQSCCPCLFSARTHALGTWDQPKVAVGPACGGHRFVARWGLGFHGYTCRAQDGQDRGNGGGLHLLLP